MTTSQSKEPIGGPVEFHKDTLDSRKTCIDERDYEPLLNPIGSGTKRSKPNNAYDLSMYLFEFSVVESPLSTPTPTHRTAGPTISQEFAATIAAYPHPIGFVGGTHDTLQAASRPDRTWYFRTVRFV